MERGVEFRLGVRSLADEQIFHRQRYGNFALDAVAGNLHRAVVHARRLIDGNVKRNVKPLVPTFFYLVFAVFRGSFHGKERVRIPARLRAVIVVNIFDKDILFMIDADIFLREYRFPAR